MKNEYSDMPRLHNEPKICGFFLFNYMEVVFLRVFVTKGPNSINLIGREHLRSQVSIYNVDKQIYKSL